MAVRKNKADRKKMVCIRIEDSLMIALRKKANLLKMPYSCLVRRAITKEIQA